MCVCIREKESVREKERDKRGPPEVNHVIFYCSLPEQCILSSKSLDFAHSKHKRIER